VLPPAIAGACRTCLERRGTSKAMERPWPIRRGINAGKEGGILFEGRDDAVQQETKATVRESHISSGTHIIPIQVSVSAGNIFMIGGLKLNFTCEDFPGSHWFKRNGGPGQQDIREGEEAKPAIPDPVKFSKKVVRRRRQSVAPPP